MLFVAQPIQNLSRRIAAHAPQPIVYCAAAVVDDCVNVIRHQNVADEFIRKTLARFAQHVNENLASLSAFKNGRAIVRDKRDVMKCVRLV